MKTESEMTRFFYAFSLGIKPDRFLKPVGFALSDVNRVFNISHKLRKFSKDSKSSFLL